MLRDGRNRDFRKGLILLTKHKLGESELSHLRNIKSGDFGFRGNPVSDEDLEHPVQHETKGEDEAQQSGNTYKLSSKLAGVPVEQSGNRTADAIPAATVVTGAVSEQSDRKDPPEPIGAVNGNCADMIVGDEVCAGLPSSGLSLRNPNMLATTMITPIANNGFPYPAEKYAIPTQATVNPIRNVVKLRPCSVLATMNPSFLLPQQRLLISSRSSN
jgi:hypothetical protein